MFIRSIDNLEKIWEYPWPSTSADHSFRKLEEIYVSNCKNLQKVLPSPMRARRLANLRRLVISDCEMLQEVFEIERSNTVEEREATASQLSYLGLRYLPKLKHVWPKDSQGSSHLLFRNLKEINVDGCHNLESLCPPSVAKGLLQLQTLYIKDCKMLKEIISKDQEEEETVPHRVFFPQLTRLSLGRLPQLMSFYPAEPQGLSFQEEKSGLIEANYPIKQQQPHSLMDKVAFPILRNIYIEFMDNLKTIWACPSTAADSFSKLEEIDVRHCKNLEKIIPSSMWSTLQKLTKLSIYNCEMVEEVFEIETRSNVEETTTQLRNLNLRDLPKPRHMWTKDPQDNHILFQNLKDIGLSDCPKLESLFPPSIAKGLLRLERLEISDCEMLKEIVSKEEEETDGIEKMPKFVLPQLKYLKLTNLPNLVSFYPTLHTSEWPSLESLKVKECAKVTVLAMKVVSRIIEEEKSGILAPINSQTQKPFFLMEKVIFPELKSLILTGNIDFPEEFAKVFSKYYCILGGELWKGDINMTLEELWKTRHNNPLTSIQEEDAQKDIEKNSQEISENESEDESKRSSGRDSGEDSEQDMEEDFKGDFKKDFQQEDSKNNSEEDSASISDLEEDSEKDSKEDADDDDEDTKNDNNYVEDFDEDSEKTSEESSEEDSKEDIEEDSEESSEEDSDKKDQSTEEASEKDLEDNFEEKSKTDSSEDKEEDSSHSEQNSEDS
ncbi:LRR domain containing protein [Trema orientale]|uniref:LRR domain containing protein n=1 Tax=Trema orientale TaxID=63057 RepID=A0A2P5G084_TREOI|nr:LRR domain containing protein [Trema orientale]